MALQNSVSVCPALITDHLSAAQDFMSEQLQCPDDRLKPFIDYITNRRGKMIRASVLLLAGRLFGDTTPLQIKIAAVVEMIHAATLLHDDVIDNGQSRRYNATANSLWGANQAVLLGDYILSRAFLTAASLQRNDINKILTETADTICRGEMLQNACRGDLTIGVEEYLEIIEKKTASFFANAALLGAVVSGANDISRKSLFDFGLNLGLAFQINDDLIDVVGTQKDTGKDTGKDSENKILTMPVIKSIDFSKSQIAQYRQKAFTALELFGSAPAAAALKELAISITQSSI